MKQKQEKELYGRQYPVFGSIFGADTLLSSFAPDRPGVNSLIMLDFSADLQGGRNRHQKRNHDLRQGRRTVARRQNHGAATTQYQVLPIVCATD